MPVPTLKDELAALKIARPPAAPSRPWVKWVVLLVLLAVAGGGAVRYLNRPRPVEVDTAAVGQRAAGVQASVLNASGYVTARRRATVSSKITGKVVEVNVEEGMAVTQGTARLWLDKTGCPICEGYGLSETSPSATCNPVDSSAFNGSIGLPIPSTELVLLDDEGAEAPQGSAGEIAIRGPQVMAGYWQRPDETAKAMTADGFFRTGDIGVMDERGYFRIIDRKKDMILVSGFNVYPNEIEDVLSQLPGVVECAAVGVADEKTGEAVKVVIVRKSPALTEAEVRAWCEANLTGYKRPRMIEFRSDLPKSTVGKILRRELREAKR